MRVATRGDGQILYLLPGVQTAANGLRAEAAAFGIITYVPDYGGARTESIVAQLIEWRDEAVASGEPFYRVSPFAIGKHGVGGAFDLKIGRRDSAGRITTDGCLPAGMTLGQAYQWLGDACVKYGLRWGGHFPKPADIYHFESQQTRDQLAARWAEWIASPDFPNAPDSGADALGAINWQLGAAAVLLAVLLYLVTRKRHV